MPRAIVHNHGLSQRLGEEISLAKAGTSPESREFGTLVYYPDKFALFSKGNVKPIKEGDIIGLEINFPRIGRSYFVDYKYTKKI